MCYADVSLPLFLYFLNSIVIRLQARWQELQFDYRQEQEIFLFSAILRPGLQVTLSPSLKAPQFSPLALSGRGEKVDHSPPADTEIMNAWIYISTPPYVLMACLNKHSNNFVTLPLFSIYPFSYHFPLALFVSISFTVITYDAECNVMKDTYLCLK
jgi:hypothetical protein